MTEAEPRPRMGMQTRCCCGRWKASTLTSLCSPYTSAHMQELYQECLNRADTSGAQEALHTMYQGPGLSVVTGDIKC